ncbi:MAG: hypothetical protein A2289_15135 [Deltaproteobacteria bacterium RIFOXYA12_FULL_58_15]|nr:MAG: hypothetical protein A2289_15135 [Deltaproteobacteria bacterium RIFOXYA12_FULL_58_15]OGR13782.1 MAG: hypothetical protein A2341_01070 [Deltaproteobacteria bacterium RIFOXYB12_FULL_58_9]
MEYIVSALEMRELDRQTIEVLGVPGRALMEVAGRGVADSCVEYLPDGGTVAVVCSTGNNGGDGFVTARTLADRGYNVHTFIVGDKTKLKADAASALKPIEKLRPESLSLVEDAKSLYELSEFIESADLIVDALLGTGLAKEVSGLIGDVIDALNESECSIIAVDIPSGVDSDTGAVLGRATECVETVTFAFPKRGHCLYPGAGLRGDLTVVDIGIPVELAADLPVVGRLLLTEDGEDILPDRDPAAHKGSFGHAVIMAGSPATPGAALLALAGALRSGAGLVSWAVSQQTLKDAPPRPLEVMLRCRQDGDSLDDWSSCVLEHATALCVGPGLSTGDDKAAELGAVLEACRVPICMDADALNLFAEDPSLWDVVQAPVVITPHPKELSRLTGISVADIQRDRFAAAGQFAIARRCVVVLKGAGTVIADPDGQVAIIGAGNPGMGTGGTGDVLAGIITGLLAQGLTSADAARGGALLHAVAGDVAAELHGEAGMRATDLIEAMGTVLARWGK